MILCDEIFATAESHTWAERLDAAGMVWGLIQTSMRSYLTPQSDALGAFREIPNSEYPVRTVTPPFDLRGSEMSIKGFRAPWRTFARNLGRSGFSEQEIQKLYTENVVS